VSGVSRCLGAIASRCRSPKNPDHISWRQMIDGATDKVLKESRHCCIVDEGVSIGHSGALER
jgi:hypothetical protein